jgi:phosphatidylglycerol:prolipoprotein diacylglycerol transferase
MVALGFLSGIVHWTRRARSEGWPPEIGADLGLWTMVGGLIGARAAYVAANWPEYRGAPFSILRFDRGGLVYYGGFVGGVVAVAILARQRKRPLLEMGDFAIGAVPLGHAIGRVGCFINGCCYGVPTAGPLGCVVAGARRHPVQLYEAMANLAIYLVLLRARPRRTGGRLALYLMLYPPARFLLEFWRGDARLRWMGLTLAQLLSAALFAVGVLLWFRPPVPRVEGSASGSARRARGPTEDHAREA